MHSEQVNARLRLLQQLAAEIYGRPPDSRWTCAEETAALEVCRRAKFEDELELIRSQWRNVRWFPQTLFGLLDRWPSMLDRVRFAGPKHADAVPLHMRLRAVEELIQSHPGNPENAGQRTPEQRNEYRRLVQIRKELLRKIAFGE